MRQVKFPVNHNFWIILTLLLHLHHFSFSQISGIVEDAKSRKPIAGVEVFVNQSSIFGESDVDGTFKLNTPPYGFINLVLYKEGYELYYANMRVQSGRTYTLSLSLSPNGKKDERTKMDVADNIETGYRKITYFIKSPASSDFVRYQRLSTSGLSQTVSWETKCKELYDGSLHHWLKTMVSGKAEEAGFEMSVAGSVVSGKSFINTTSLLGYYRLSFPNSIEVRYKNSINHLTATTALDVSEQGVLLNPKLLTVEGSMQMTNLPVDYEPIEGKVDEVFAEVMKRYYEKIYVHTDKPYYYQGEPMWFKVYINYYYPQWRDSLSKVLYVELISPSKEIMLEKMLKIDSGYAAGDFILPDTLKRGDYYLRAYTNLQRNFGSENLYVKQIPILGITDKVDPSQGDWNPHSSERITFKTDKEYYNKRDKVNITIEVKDKVGNPIDANLSISVTDASQVLPVPIPSVTDSYPLAKYDINIPENLRFKLERGICLQGIYLNSKGKPEKALFNFVQWKSNNTAFTETGNAGAFELNGLDFYDSTRFFYNGGSKKEEGKIVIERRDIPPVKLDSVIELNLSIVNSESSQRIISEYEVPKDAKLLKELIIHDKKIEDYDQKSTYGRADNVITKRDIKLNYSNILYSLVGAVPGLYVYINPNGAGGTVIFARASGLSVANAHGPLVTINDIPMGGDAGETLSRIDPSTVERIEITKRLNPLYGSFGANGVIAVYTRQFEDKPFLETAKSFMAKGYSTSRLLASPDYDHKSKNKSDADYRSIVFWNPSLMVRKLPITFSFFTSDLETIYRVVVEGLTSENEPVRAEYFIEVKN